MSFIPPPVLVHGPALLYLPLRSPPAYSALLGVSIAFALHPTRHGWLDAVSHKGHLLDTLYMLLHLF